MRDPRLLDLLDRSAPVTVTDAMWARPIRIGTHLGRHELPDELITSVRCLVRVEDQVVVCTNVDGRTEVLPGGRREPGETLTQTVCREVHEETGFMLQSDSLAMLGFLHLFNKGEPQPPYPHPDTLMLVMTGQADPRTDEAWTDTEGYVLASNLRDLDELGPDTIDTIGWPYLQALREQASG